MSDKFEMLFGDEEPIKERIPVNQRGSKRTPLIIDLDSDGEVIMDLGEYESSPVVMEFDDEASSPVAMSFGDDPVEMEFDLPEEDDYVSAEMADFMDEGSSVVEMVLYEDEEIEDPYKLDTGNAPLRVLDVPASQTAVELANSYTVDLDVLQATLSVGNSTAREDSIVLGRMVQSAALPFLTASEEASLVPIIFRTQDKDEVVKEFYKQTDRSFNSVQILTIYTEVVKILMDYTAYMNNHASSQRVLREKSVKSDKIMSKVDKDLQVLLRETHDAVYVSKIKTSSEGYRYTCGRCGTENLDSRGFFNFIVHENFQERSSLLKAFPRACVCDNCQTPNLLTQVEHLKVSMHMSEAYKEELKRWSSSSVSSRVTADTSPIEYIPPYNMMPIICGEVFSLEEEVAVAEETVEVDVSELNKWFEETKRLVKAFRVYSPKTEGGHVVKNQTVVPEYKSMFTELEVVARTYCRMFNYDFDRTMKSATNSVLMFFQEYPMMQISLSLEDVWVNKRILLYESYLENKEVTDSPEILFTILNSLGKLSDPNASTKDMVSRLKEEIETSKKNLEIHAKNRSKMIDLLRKITPLAFVIPIMNISEIDYEPFRSLLADPEVANWIRECSIVMVLNKVAPRARELWATRWVGHPPGQGYNNKSMFSKQSKKTVSGRFDIMMKSYAKHAKPYGERLKLFSSMYSCNVVASDRYLEFLNNLSESFVEFNLYKFWSCVKRLKEVAIPMTMEEVHFELRGRLDEADDFFTKFKEDSDLDFYLCHYGDIFSKEEIEEGLIQLEGERIKSSYYFEREKDESFVDYMKVAASGKARSLGRKAAQDPSREVFIPLMYLYSMIRLNQQLVRYVTEDTELDDFMRDIIVYSPTLGAKYMYEFLGLELPYRVDYENLGKLYSEKVDGKVEALKFIYKGLVLPDSELASVYNVESDNPMLDVVWSNYDRFIDVVEEMGQTGKELVGVYGSLTSS